MNNKEMIGMFSAYAAAKEMPYGSNMTISAALVVEMVERIVELEKDKINLIEEFAEAACLGEVAKIARQYGYEALNEPSL
jgi:hypothetical protein